MSGCIDSNQNGAQGLVSLCHYLLQSPLPKNRIDAARIWLDACSAEDIAIAVDFLVAEGLEMEALKRVVSKLLNLHHRQLAEKSFEPHDPFFRTLVLENRRIISALDRLRAPVAELNQAATRRKSDDDLCFLANVSDIFAAANAFATAIEPLEAATMHFVRKENVLFPYFEARFPRYRCLSLMWSLHDDVRSALSYLRRLCSILLTLGGKGDGASAISTIAEITFETGRLFFAVHSLVFREEKILFPLMVRLFEEQELVSLYREIINLGPGLLRLEDFEVLEAIAKSTEGLVAHNSTISQSDVSKSHMRSIPAQEEHIASLQLDSGSLDLGLLDTILKNLPLDMTFIDAENQVRYFSNGANRIFPRSPAIIGRNVANCHPASSVGKVLRIIEALRTGEQEAETFWIEHQGRFIKIEYQALRSSSGEYLGTLEISQDITDLRSLRGEKRLASFEAP